MQRTVSTFAISLRLYEAELSDIYLHFSSAQAPNFFNEFEGGAIKKSDKKPI